MDQQKKAAVAMLYPDMNKTTGVESDGPKQFGLHSGGGDRYQRDMAVRLMEQDRQRTVGTVSADVLDARR